ncbi:MAG: hypothetical protein IPM15_01210 [Betaproteobacteria bacterium]|nr:hypothetical protein [Betaproteobacteria bacterium]MCC6246715.1 hypothetical protein [Rubrivivax sp.]
MESAGTTVARLFDAARVQVAEFDAGTEEAAQMMAGLVAERGAEASDWDRALEGHSLEERRAAEIYRLAV